MIPSELTRAAVGGLSERILRPPKGENPILGMEEVSNGSAEDRSTWCRGNESSTASSCSSPSGRRRSSRTIHLFFCGCATPPIALAGVDLPRSRYAAKAWGGQRLFTRDERPSVLALAAAGGAASVGGCRAPGSLRRGEPRAMSGAAASGTVLFVAVALSIFLLGLLDGPCRRDRARVGRLHIGHMWAAGCRSGWGLSPSQPLRPPAAVVKALPRLAAGPLVSRFRVSGWVRDNANAAA